MRRIWTSAYAASSLNGIAALDIILVDDGSTDASQGLCDEWAGADSRVRVIHAPNGGLSRARNRGLDLAIGEYVTFVDADDLLGPDHVARLVEVALHTGVELVAAGLVQFADDGPGPVFRPGGPTKVTPSDDALLEIVRRGIGFESCGKFRLRVAGRRALDPTRARGPRRSCPAVAGAAMGRSSDVRTARHRQHPGSLMCSPRAGAVDLPPAVLFANITFAVERHGVGSPSAQRLTVAYALHAARVLEGSARAGVWREPGFDRAYRQFIAEHLALIVRADELSWLYRSALVVSRVSPDVFAAGFGVARWLKASVAPNLRRASGPPEPTQTIHAYEGPCCRRGASSCEAAQHAQSDRYIGGQRRARGLTK